MRGADAPKRGSAALHEADAPERVTLFATVMLLVYMGTFQQMAGLAADPFVDLTTDANATSIRVHALAAIAAVVVIPFVMLHLFGGGMHRTRTYACLTP